MGSNPIRRSAQAGRISTRSRISRPFAFQWRGRIKVTGRPVRARTSCATDPWTHRRAPVRPWEAMQMKSAPSRSAAWAMARETSKAVTISKRVETPRSAAAGGTRASRRRRSSACSPEGAAWAFAADVSTTVSRTTSLPAGPGHRPGEWPGSPGPRDWSGRAPCGPVGTSGCTGTRSGSGHAGNADRRLVHERLRHRPVPEPTARADRGVPSTKRSAPSSRAMSSSDSVGRP